MLSMADNVIPLNVIPLKEWKAQQQRKLVPVYEVVRDPYGVDRLELVEWVEWDEARALG
jgi:hypothetical protein